MNANHQSQSYFLLLAICLMALMINIDYTAVNLALIPMALAHGINAALLTATVVMFVSAFTAWLLIAKKSN